MKTKIPYDPSKHTPRANALVLVRAQQWACSPDEAAKRLLDEAAQKANGKAAA